MNTAARSRRKIFLALALAGVLASVGALAASRGTGTLQSSVDDSTAFRATFEGTTVRVAGADSRSATPWNYSLAPAAFGREGSLRLDPANDVAIGEAKATYRFPGMETTVSRSKEGVRHEFIVDAPSFPAEGFLLLDLAVSGDLEAKLDDGGQVVDLALADGTVVARFGKLEATDARGRNLRVALSWADVKGSAADRGLRVSVDDTDAAYPIAVRSLLAPAAAPAGDVAISPRAFFAPPANDDCAGAEVIPDGPYPVLSAVTADITDATTTGNPGAPSCQSNVTRSIWYQFTPTVTANYTISSCADAGTGSTVDDMVLAVYTSAAGCAGAFTQVTGGCDDDSCATEGLQAVINDLPLTAGTTYYVLAHKFGTTAPTAGNTAVQLKISRFIPPPPPANDDCGTAEVIPAAGPFPHLTAVTDIFAGTTGSDPAASCLATTSRGVWYSFTPAASGSYQIETCNTATGTTLPDTVLALFTGAGACTAPYTSVGCNDNACASQSVVATGLTAGTTYYVLAYKSGATAPVSGASSVQLRVSQVVPPVNDTCAGALPLTLGIPLADAMTAVTADDYQLSGLACYTGVGQPTSTSTATNAVGRDLAYTFTAPAAGDYSFRVNSNGGFGNPVIYIASACPVGPSPQTVATCLAAANRNGLSSVAAEEVMCYPMTAGQQVYVFVDDSSTSTLPTHRVEVTRCVREVEANGTPASANAFVCGIEGTISPAGDADFFSLPPTLPNQRVFALADGLAGNSTDFDLRITTATDTLEYDDANADTPHGTLSPTADGTKATGAATFVRMSHFSGTTVAEPYRLYAAVQPEDTAAVAETEPNDAIATANVIPTGYVAGSLAAAADADVFAITAGAGDLIFAGLDQDPGYDNTPINGTLTLLDAAGNTLIAVNDGGTTSSTRAPVAASLTSTAPVSNGEALAYRVSTAGTYFVRVGWSSGTTPNNYLLSLTVNCLPPASDTDLEILKGDAPDPVQTLQNLTYTLTVRNNGPNVASNVTVTDTLPATVTFVSAVGPAGWTCGHAAGVVTCTNPSVAVAVPQVITIVVSVNQCQGNGQITNVARVRASNNDPIAANDVATESTNVVDLGNCSDNDACTAGDTCVGNVCQGGPPPACDDGDACTLNQCNPATGLCENPAIVCDDGRACTDDSCVPATGCLFVADDTNTCTDNNGCTTDVCQNGTCNSTPSVTCDDLNPCTDDACNPATGLCEFTNDDTNACTDGDPCTTDLCRSGVCVSAILATGSSAGAITINDMPSGGTPAAATPYPSTITIPASYSGTVTEVEVELNGLSHTFPDDVDILLVGPTGANAVIVSDAGLGTDAVNVNLVLRDSAATAIPDDGPMVSGTFKPSSYLTGDTFPAPAPTPAGGSALSVFNGTTPAGVWSLYVVDDANLDSGSMAGWQLRIRLNCDDGNPCTVDTCDANGCVHTPVGDGTACDDGSACTSGDVCTAGVCSGAAVVCIDNNVCTDDQCDPASGCVFPSNNAPCDDGDGCTTQDTCSNGSCVGGPVITAPGEVADLRYTATPPDKQTIVWAVEPSATRYDVVRGVIASLPVGPGGGDETCVPDLLTATLVDPANPTAPGGFFYVTRGENACGAGPYGNTHTNPGPPLNGPARTTTTCP